MVLLFEAKVIKNIVVQQADNKVRSSTSGIQRLVLLL